MKKTTLAFVMFILTISLFGCGKEVPSQDTFKEDFTIGVIVEDNAQYLIPGSRELSGSEYGSPDQPFTQKQEEMAIQIEESNLPEFIIAIRSDIEEAIIDSGASIVGRGSGGLTEISFSTQYQADQVFGVIDVWGVRGKGTNFYLIVMITES